MDNKNILILVLFILVVILAIFFGIRHYKQFKSVYVCGNDGRCLKCTGDGCTDKNYPSVYQTKTDCIKGCNQN